MSAVTNLDEARVPRFSADYGRETVFGSVSPAPAPPQDVTDISNEVELREALAVANKKRADAQTAHAAAVAANARGASMLEEAKAALAVARVDADRAGGNLAERIAAWATNGGEDPRLGLTDAETEAHRRLDAAVATEAAASQACEALRASLAAREKQRAEAVSDQQTAVYRVVARDMEAAAKRVEELRAEADRLEHGVALFGTAFAQGASLGVRPYAATTRLSPAYHGTNRWPTAQSREDAAASRAAIGDYVRALSADPGTPLPPVLHHRDLPAGDPSAVV